MTMMMMMMMKMMMVMTEKRRQTENSSTNYYHKQFTEKKIKIERKKLKNLTNRKDIFQFPSEHPEIHQECNTFTIRIQNVDKTKQNKQKTPKKELQGKKENESSKKELRTSDSLTVDSKWPMGQINT